MAFVRNIKMPVINNGKKHISNLPKAVNVLGKCIKALDVNADFLRLYGPTANEITRSLDLSNKTCLITGANSGIGLEMTKCLSSRDCTVLMACRNTYAANVVKNACEKSHLLQLYEVNLASLKSVRDCSDNILTQHEKIDIVILNAGVFGLPWTLTDDNLETTFQVNYLSQYYLLMNIEKILATDARVVIISSESHRNVKWHMYNVLSPTEQQLSLPKEEYTSIRAYNVSKLCGVLAMHYLGYRWLYSGKSVFCAHPGSFVKTRLCRNWWVYEAMYTCFSLFTKSIAQAVSTPLYCATSPELQGLSALYFKDCKRHCESDLAKDSHLSFRIMDLTQEILRDRIASIDVLAEPLQYEEPIKGQTALEEHVISSYTA